jgi:hypothetical protein
MSRGWIPGWLPVAATDIHEVHDLDTNEGAVTFRLAPGSKWRPLESCRPAQGGMFTEPRFSRHWIPDLDGATYYSCTEEQGTGTPLLEAVAILPGGERVLYWRAFSK